MAILRCNVITNDVGVKQYVPFAMEDDKKATLINDGIVAFNVFPNGDKVDMRENPPFLTMVPCPYCGSESEHKHEPLKHVDRLLGCYNGSKKNQLFKNSQDDPSETVNNTKPKLPPLVGLMVGDRDTDIIVRCKYHQLHHNAKWGCPHCRSEPIEKVFERRWDTSSWAADVLAHYKKK